MTKIKYTCLLFSTLLWLIPNSNHAQEFFKSFHKLADKLAKCQKIEIYPDESFGLTITDPDNNVIDPAKGWWLHRYRFDRFGTPQDTFFNYYNKGFSNNSRSYITKSGTIVQGAIYPDSLVVMHLTLDAKLIWQTTVPYSKRETFGGPNISINEQGEIFLRAYSWESTPQQTIVPGFVCKIAPNGKLLWVYDFLETLGVLIEKSIFPTADGGCLFHLTKPYVVRKLDANGSPVWDYPLPLTLHEEGHEKHFVYQLRNSNSVFLFLRKLANPKWLIQKVNGSGQKVWEYNMTDSLLDIKSNYVTEAIVNEDSSLFVLVNATAPNLAKYYLLKINSNGSTAWKRPLNVLNDQLAIDFKTTQSSLAPGGGGMFFWMNDTKMTMVKFNSEGAVYPFSVSGKISFDVNKDCQLQASDPVLPFRKVVAQKGNESRYGFSDGNGQYKIDNLDAGSYSIKLIPDNFLWATCTDSLVFTIPPNDSNANFLARILADCPLLSVDLGTPFLRRCFPSKYVVKYCNLGTSSAENAQIGIILDKKLDFSSASLPFVKQNDTLVFEVGTVSPGSCGVINLTVTPRCSDTELGDILCTSAFVLPDTLCSGLAGWAGANIQTYGVCEGDSVRFWLKNTGTSPTSHPINWKILKNSAIQSMGNLTLSGGEEFLFTRFADDAVWRLLADQEETHPLFNHKPNSMVADCPSGSGNSPENLMQSIGLGSGKLSDQTNCTVVIGAFDPNDKNVQPSGIESENFIEPNQSLKYTIRFQNTGTDTAFNISIFDEIDANSLDFSSIRLGASSHPCKLDLQSNNLAKFVFNGIMLPDSNKNVTESQGFVQFEILQKPELTDGTMIKNHAAIYFDFNPPVFTNTVFNTIQRNYPIISGGSDELNTGSENEVRIYPNPTNDFLQIEIKKGMLGKKKLQIWNSMGEKILETSFWGLKHTFLIENLLPGFYSLNIFPEKGTTFQGRLLIVR